MIDIRIVKCSKYNNCTETDYIAIACPVTASYRQTIRVFFVKTVKIVFVFDNIRFQLFIVIVIKKCTKPVAKVISMLSLCATDNLS